MALSAATVWEVRTAGSDTACSGGFIAGASGTDYSQQNAAQYTGTNLVIDGALNTKVTSATHNFVAADVGNLIQVTAGTNFTVGFYQIVSVASNAATLDRAVGTVGATGGTFAVGGALATPGMAFSAVVGGNDIYVKAGGTFSVSVNTNNVASGKMAMPAGTVTDPTRLIGYSTTRTPTNTDTKPVVQVAAGPTGSLVAAAGNYNEVYNVDFDGNSKAIIGLDDGGAYVRYVRCRVHGFAGGQAVVGFGPGQILLCEIDNNTQQGLKWGGVAWGCYIHDNVSIALYTNGTKAFFAYCIIDTTTTLGASEGAVYVNQADTTLLNCVVYSSNKDGVYIAGGWVTAINCIAEGCTLNGFTAASAGTMNRLINCAGYNNTTANYNTTNLLVVEGFQALSGSPFTNAAGGDFSLNSTAGTGAALRGTGLPGVFPGATTTSFVDIGAAQHLDSGNNRLLLEDG